MKTTILLSLAASTTLAAKAGLLADAPSGSSIRNIAVRGTGCPAGQSSYQFDADGALTIYTPNMQAAAGAGANVAAQRQACTLLADITAPTGWQFALAHAQVSGRADLQEGASAQQGGRVFFAGVDGTESFSTPFQGPMQRPYVLDYNENDKPNALWSKCGGESVFNVNFNAFITGGTGNFTIDRTRLFTSWRQCS